MPSPWRPRKRVCGVSPFEDLDELDGDGAGLAKGRAEPRFLRLTVDS
jgi:hypothetical protein